MCILPVVFPDHIHVSAISWCVPGEDASSIPGPGKSTQKTFAWELHKIRIQSGLKASFNKCIIPVNQVGIDKYFVPVIGVQWEHFVADPSALVSGGFLAENRGPGLGSSSRRGNCKRHHECRTYLEHKNMLVFHKRTIRPHSRSKILWEDLRIIPPSIKILKQRRRFFEP